MRKIIIYCLFFGINMYAQEINNAIELMDKVSFRLKNIEPGSTIEFEYIFENESYKMPQAINGSLSLFSDNRFYLEFNSYENKMIQLYNGIVLYTILPEEKEIQIDTMDENNGVFIQSILNNFKNEFTANIKDQNNELTLVELVPKKIYDELVYNQCIDTLQLPSCLKLPNQCKIGISKNMQKLLNKCLDENDGYDESEILKVEITINHNTMNMESIKQINRYNGQTTIKINSITTASLKLLNIDGLYPDFEVIDLR